MSGSNYQLLTQEQRARLQVFGFVNHSMDLMNKNTDALDAEIKLRLSTVKTAPAASRAKARPPVKKEEPKARRSLAKELEQRMRSYALPYQQALLANQYRQKANLIEAAAAQTKR